MLIQVANGLWFWDSNQTWLFFFWITFSPTAPPFRGEATQAAAVRSSCVASTGAGGTSWYLAPTDGRDEQLWFVHEVPFHHFDSISFNFKRHLQVQVSKVCSNYQPTFLFILPTRKPWALWISGIHLYQPNGQGLNRLLIHLRHLGGSSRSQCHLEVMVLWILVDSCGFLWILVDSCG